MILTIRTDKPEAEIGLFDGLNKVDYKTWYAHRELSVTILGSIVDILDRNKASLRDISGVVVYRGPGSYTGLRIGITVANTLAYGCAIPVVGSNGDDWVLGGIKGLSSASACDYVSPEYGGEAHITKPRK